MRTTRDRIRHAISFELLGLTLAIPLGAIGFGMHAADIGVVTVICATIATLWNYVYNLQFDRIMRHIRGTTHKTLAIRVLHALAFEGGLLVITLPVIALYLQIGLWQALMMDVAFALFYLIYAFIFNWIYDLVFPIPVEA